MIYNKKYIYAKCNKTELCKRGNDPTLNQKLSTSFEFIFQIEKSPGRRYVETLK